ncbi:Splicing factor 3B subunit 1 [Hypsibius exemplaris]|uniref:Splicing factor 3B subunit 1 n=1 Tax=Hypsibius exemplaris TaxID=2072580 RepID=A0A1W0WVI2_HYPEX|nr:Splicing factor 3B subunit 1 [Hypsibius exemplaris]
MSRSKPAKSSAELDQQMDEIRKKAAESRTESDDYVGLGDIAMDEEIYDGGKKNKYEGFLSSIGGNDDDEDEEDEITARPGFGAAKSAYKVSLAASKENAKSGEDFDPMAEHKRQTVADRENEYQARRRKIRLSPDRADPFADGGKTPDVSSRTYSHIIKEHGLAKDTADVQQQLRDKAKAGELHVVGTNGSAVPRKRARWDVATPDAVSGSLPAAAMDATPEQPQKWAATPQQPQKWDATPAHIPVGSATPSMPTGVSRWDATPGAQPAAGAVKRNRWDETPRVTTGSETPNASGWAETPRADRGDGQETPGASKRRSRWDETPMAQTPSMMTPGMSTPIGMRAMGMATPTPGHLMSMTPEQHQALRFEKEMDDRNRYMADDELDALFPPGYKVLPPPTGYQPIRTPARKLMATPTPMGGMGLAGFFLQQESMTMNKGIVNSQPSDPDLPMMKPEDMQHFDKLLLEDNEDSLSPEEAKERQIMKLLLKIKNGTPPMRKSAMRQITDKARVFGAGALFNQILPLLMAPTLEDQERHLLVKVIDRVLYKLDDMVRPYVHKILVVIEPLLIDEDYYARVEGREIISNLAKAAGLASMIYVMRPDIDNVDEYVRNTTARAFAVVASALGIPSLIPFLKAVCKSKKSWQARHTGIKIVQQISILMGCAVLPHLKSLVELTEHGLEDEQQKVRTITALSLAALAEAAAPYGIESFDSVLKPLWHGIRTHRGKGLAAFLKAIGFLIPLMDAEYASYYTREVMIILIREFSSPDEEMKKIVLKVVKQCCGTEGVEPQYIKDEILPHFFRAFWNHRMALDKRNYKQLVETTVEIANKVGAATIVAKIVDDLKDENEQYRKMVMETIEKVLETLGSADIDARLEELLIDGILYAFQEQTTEDVVMLSGFGMVVNSLGKRCKPYLPQICGTILWRLNNKAAKVRQQAADLISKVAGVMKLCNEEKLMGHLGVVLYEYLGEEYPEVLGSILGALKAIVNVIGMTKMTPPIKDLLPRLTPILKNRHEKVQENCIDLVGRIADRGAEYVSAREWMRICFELLELLKAHKKAIRRATVNTFGYIAKAIGPHDVLATLLNNLKVQERQNRVCTTVAIAIVAETCSPFTVLPALMNEYRVPELNVQNGVLKAISFMFEYIGEMGKDYIYAVTPLLEDALMDRDLVHRQTACSAVAHMTLGVFGFGCEDALNHILNCVWPNIFETSPHMAQAFMASVEAMRVSLGPMRLLQYTLQGLFHPARRVRENYWRVYNTLYIGAQDAMVAAYPRVPNDEKNVYERYELDYVL